MRIQRPVGCSLQGSGEFSEIRPGFVGNREVLQQYRRGQPRRNCIRIRERIARRRRCPVIRKSDVGQPKEAIERRTNIRRMRGQRDFKISQRVLSGKIHAQRDHNAAL